MEERDVRIQVANGEYPDKRLWLELPISDDPDWIKTTAKLVPLAVPGQTEVTLRVKDVESPVPNLKRYILADNGKIAVSQMNLLAQEISAMSENDLRKFSGALDIESISGFEDIRRVADSLGDYEIFPGVATEKELGVYLVESGDVDIHESALPYVDFSRVGTEYYANHSCAYGDNCLVVKKDETEIGMSMRMGGQSL